MAAMSSLKPVLKNAYLRGESLLLKLPYGDRAMEGSVALCFFLLDTYRYLEGEQMETPRPARSGRGCRVEGNLRQEIKGYIDSLVDGLDERLDKKFNKRANSLEADLQRARIRLAAMEEDALGTSQDAEMHREELASYKAMQKEKDERAMSAFRATEAELERLREKNSGLEDSNRRLLADKGDAARQLEEKERELKALKEATGPQYGFDMLLPVLDMEIGGRSAYIRDTQDVYTFAAWIERAKALGLDREYMDSVIGGLREGCGILHRKQAKRIFEEMLKGPPDRAVEVLSRNRLIK